MPLDIICYRTFHNLGEIALVDYRISGTGSFTTEIIAHTATLDDEEKEHLDMDQIWQQLNNVFELDLSKNLISNWDTVNEIVGSLPGLKCLRLK